MVSRLPTQSYPDNLRFEWVTKPLSLPTYDANGLLGWSYEVFPTQRSMEARDRPFLRLAHKAMVRITHQRIALAGENRGGLSTYAVGFLSSGWFTTARPKVELGD